MGGQIAVAFRFADASVECYEVWTNPMPVWLKSREVIVDKDESYVRAYINECVAAGDPVIPLAPSGYGLVVIDFLKGQFMSMQGYTSFDTISNIEASGLINSEKNGNYLKLAEARRVIAIRREIKNRSFTGEEHRLLIPDLQTARAMMGLAALSARSFGDEDYEMVDFEIVFEPTFTYTDLEEYSGTREYLTRLRELDFHIDAATEALWEERIKEYEDDAEEEES
jgi:hypothetical protein